MSTCEHCGSDPYHEQLAERAERHAERLTKALEREVAQHAVEVARLRLAELDRCDDRKGLQRKVATQRRTINRLETKLRKLGAAPYTPESVQPSPASTEAPEHPVGDATAPTTVTVGYRRCGKNSFCVRHDGHADGCAYTANASFEAREADRRAAREKILAEVAATDTSDISIGIPVDDIVERATETAVRQYEQGGLLHYERNKLVYATALLVLAIERMDGETR